MSLEDFWVNVRSACVRFRADFPIDRPFITLQVISDELGKDNYWYRKHSVAGFKIEDFEFLGENRQSQLGEWVKQFKDIAPEAGTTTDSRDPEKNKVDAKKLFSQIVATLEFPRFGNAEGLRVGKQIDDKLGNKLPQKVKDLRVDAGTDFTGEPCLWIWVFIDEANSSNDASFLKAAKEAEDTLDPIAREVAPDRWPFFRVLSVDEAGMSRFELTGHGVESETEARP
jgi:hypothetical protein